MKTILISAYVSVERYIKTQVRNIFHVSIFFESLKRVDMSKITSKNISTIEQRLLKRNWENLKDYARG